MDKRKVLLIDDDADFLSQQQLRFENAGYSVHVADSIPRAKELFTEVRPDVIIVDLMMEEKDAGIVLAHHFKKQAPSVPVILVTSVMRDTGMCFDAKSADERAWINADRVLSKPVRFEQLKREIESLLK